MLWALVQFLLISRIPVRSEGISDSTGLVSGSNDEATTRRLTEIYTAIYEGAESFLRYGTSRESYVGFYSVEPSLKIPGDLVTQRGEFERKMYFHV